MNRREFIKKCGIVVGSIGGIGLLKPTEVTSQTLDNCCPSNPTSWKVTMTYNSPEGIKTHSWIQANSKVELIANPVNSKIVKAYIF